MFDLFSDRARKALSFARQEAELGKCDYIGTEHILLGILRENGGLAATILSEKQVDSERIAARIRNLTSPSTTVPLPNQIPFTPRAKTVLTSAVAAAESFSHDYVGTQHLLLGILRDQETVASTVLIEFGLSAESVSEAIGAADNERTVTVGTVTLPPGPHVTESLLADPWQQEYRVQGLLESALSEEQQSEIWLHRRIVYSTCMTVSFLGPLIFLLLQSWDNAINLFLFIMFWIWISCMTETINPKSPWAFGPSHFWSYFLKVTGVFHAVAALNISIIDPDWLWVAWCWFAAVVSFYSGDAQLSLLKTMKPPAIVEEKS